MPSLGYDDASGRTGCAGCSGLDEGYQSVPTISRADDFREFPEYRVTEWREEWSGRAQFLAVARESQHPGADANHTLWSMRRWVSTTDGRIRLTGQLRRNPKGDSSIARIFVDGKEILTRQLGGGQSLKGNFEVATTVRAGSRVDFAVDPGPAADTTLDETWFTVTIEHLQAKSLNSPNS